jgi:hypothetical protein
MGHIFPSNDTAPGGQRQILPPLHVGCPSATWSLRRPPELEATKRHPVSATSNCNTHNPVTRRLHRQHLIHPRFARLWVWEQSRLRVLEPIFFANGAGGGEVRERVSQRALGSPTQHLTHRGACRRRAGRGSSAPPCLTAWLAVRLWISVRRGGVSVAVLRAHAHGRHGSSPCADALMKCEGTGASAGRWRFAETSRRELLLQHDRLVCCLLCVHAPLPPPPPFQAAGAARGCCGPLGTRWATWILLTVGPIPPLLTAAFNSQECEIAARGG